MIFGRTILFSALTLALCGAPVSATGPLDEFATAWSGVQDYTAQLVVHETNGKDVQDRSYNLAFKKPSLAKLDIVSGPGRGGGAVWHGGDKVSGHQGGILSGIHLTVGIDDPRAVSLRGDNISVAPFGALLARLQKAPANDVVANAGPTVDGAPTDQLTVRWPDAAAMKGVTRESVLLSRTTHLPVRDVQYGNGETILKQVDFKNVKLNPGLKDSDF